MSTRYTGAVKRLLFVAVILFAGCASSVGPEGLVVGGPCVDELDCAAGSYCLSRSDFPGGTCTTTCRNDGDCRGSSACVEEEAGVCLLRCSVDADCGRERYVCRERVRRGVFGNERVCVGGS